MAFDHRAPQMMVSLGQRNRVLEKTSGLPRLPRFDAETGNGPDWAMALPRRRHIAFVEHVH
ncbi:MAG: hypothetical protein IV086_16805 [Hyphomonadaceae bacterium]|nr:hypothetical protein [Hyphomonadaceae bacterium]